MNDMDGIMVFLLMLLWYARVKSNRLYAGDVVAGTLIGTGSSLLFTKPYKDWLMQPEVTSSLYRMTFSHVW